MYLFVFLKGYCITYNKYINIYIKYSYYIYYTEIKHIL